MTTGSVGAGCRSVYVLVDPRDGTWRYCGVTRNSLVKRLGQHVSPHELQRRRPVAVWLREMVAAGMRPFIMLVERVPGAEWREAEQRWIAELRARGCPLLNGDDGGTGSEGGYSWDATARANLSRAKAGRSRGGSSGYPGVSRRPNGRWVAQLCKRHLGVFDEEGEAFTAYWLAFQERYGMPLPGYEDFDDWIRG
jgi:GIY-YIG catalytic domain./AP2 domain.